MGIMRLDKMLSNSGLGSRKDVREYIKRGRVSVDGNVVYKSDIKIDTNENEIFFDRKKISYHKYIYLMMNKPKGIVSATQDNNEKTVIDILDEKYKNRGLFPVGRLDKDTVGMLILTNDGRFAHNTLSPKKHVVKKYFAVVSGKIDETDVEKFYNGIEIDGGYLCKSAGLQIVRVAEDVSEVNVEISEGKFHQIKRMFKALGKEVLFLKRIKFGGLELDKKLEEGCTRELSAVEMKIIDSFREV